MILRCAKLCKEAYSGVKVGKHSFCVAEYPGTIVIAIAGTANFENMLEDAAVWPSWSPSRSLAHAGVMNAYNCLRDTILSRVPKDRTVLFTGHSLGGGIAQIFAEQLNAEVITFGSLKTYVRFYPAPTLRHTRVVCDDDPVPLVPGVMYSHRCEPLTLDDADHEWIDVKDHFIDNYIKRLESQNAILTLLCPVAV